MARSTWFSQLQSCPEFRSASAAACKLVANAESGGNLFGALPMLAESYYDRVDPPGPLRLALTELARVEQRLADVSTKTVSIDVIKQDLSADTAKMQDQIDRVIQVELDEARVKLRAIGGNVKLLSESVQSFRTEGVNPILNGTRLELEQLRFEFGVQQMQREQLGSLTLHNSSRRALSVRREMWFNPFGWVEGRIKELVKQASAAAITWLLNVIPFGIGWAIWNVISAACEAANCAASLWAPSIQNTLGAQGLPEAWLALSQNVISWHDRFLFRELQSDGGVHRISRAAALSAGVYQSK